MNSTELFHQAQKVIPGGVNSPVRAFKSVDATPIFIERGKGALLWDVEGRSYIDYIGSWGAGILGHAPDEVILAVKEQAEKGLSFGACTQLETELACEIIKHLPSIEKIRFVSSGTEACMSALRLARAYTGRDKIVKFVGHYHGHSDSLLVKAGSGAATFGVPDSPGVPKDLAQHTIVLPFNDHEALDTCFKKLGDEIACVIIEPIVGNSGFIRGNKDFIASISKLCHTYGSLFIFDEVMTGFRVALTGAQSLYDICPDITILGKVVGGGMPLAAFGGKAAIMDQLSPLGPVYQAGTLSGHPLATRAGLTTLQLLSRPDCFNSLSRTTETFIETLKQLAHDFQIPLSADYEGGMFGFFLQDRLPQRFEDLADLDRNLFSQVFKELTQRGIMIAPSPFEAGFVSTAHSKDHIAQTLSAFRDVFNVLNKNS